MSSTIQPFIGATVNVVFDALLNPENSKTPVDELTVEILYVIATQKLPLLANCNELVSPKITKGFSSIVSPE